MRRWLEAPGNVRKVAMGRGANHCGATRGREWFLVDRCDVVSASGVDAIGEMLGPVGCHGPFGAKLIAAS
jgi:hypothetical protein